HLAFHFAQLFGQFPEFRARGLLLKGMLLRQLGRKSDAAAEWKTLVETDNELTGLQVSAAEFLLQYGGLELEQGNPEHAAELLQRSAQLDETAETRYQLGQAEEQLGQEENAGVNWERALELNADHASARESLARLALKRNQPDRAEELLTPILNDRQLTASTAYLMQRVCTVQGNADGAAIWQARTEKLKNREYIRNTMTQLLRDDGQSYWAQVIRSYQFAEAGNWLQAEHALESLADEEDEHEFVRMLRGAVTKRGQLPPIDTFPVRLF
ncbi:MAG: hypothetical protein KDA85_20835, partial [Planctomycetaceae bacterium]|nr:hypothetical protein [Planctomycetaceae bacterium]